MDSPVLKPSLIRFSSARLIGAAAPAQIDDAEQPDDASQALEAAPAGPPQACAPAPRYAGPSIAATDAEEASPRRVIGGAGVRLREIEARSVEAEVRLAQTQELLEKLEREANLACALVEDARQQAAAIQEKARQEGYRAGVEQAENDMAERLSDVAAMAEGAVRARAEFLQRSEVEIIELAFEIARQVIGQHLSLNREAIADVARRALSIAGQADMYYLHLHPDDVDLVDRHLRRDTLGMPLEVVPDDRLRPGDCLIQTAHGRVDACVDTQLREIHEQVVGAT